MERHDGPRADASRDPARLTRGQMVLARRVLHVFVEEHALDVKQIDASEQLLERGDIRFGVTKIGDVADAPAGNDVEDQLLQLADEIRRAA